MCDLLPSKGRTQYHLGNCGASRNHSPTFYIVSSTAIYCVGLFSLSCNPSEPSHSLHRKMHCTQAPQEAAPA